jgi:hypothetical protein
MDEISLDPLYLSEDEKRIIAEQLALDQGRDLDPLIAEYVKAVNQFPFIATIRSCEGHGYPGHVSFRFTREWHEKFMAAGIRPLIEKNLCHLYLEVGTWLKTPTGLYFRWNAKFEPEKRDAFFGEFIRWLQNN